MNAQIIRLGNNDIQSYESYFENEEFFGNDEVNYQEIDDYRVYTGSNPGYTRYIKIADIPDETKLSNFYINFSRWVRTIADGAPISFYDGELVTAYGTTEFINMPAAAMEDASSFKKYVANLSGPKALMYGNPGEIVKAIKSFNNNVHFFEAKEFGYNESLTKYYTENFVITADAILDEKTPIKYKENWGNNKLGFKTSIENDAKGVRDFILNNLLTWDNPLVVYNALAFTFYPLIYPFLKEKNPNKFYLMLKGSSGAGKSQMSKWMQNFYGNFSTLFSWTSTDTSINVTGTSFKDALFCVDDLKLQNLRSDKDANKVMMVLQTYSDGTARNRANVDLTLKDIRAIKGHLMISAEDLVISETSTIARGVIIQVDSKRVKMDELSEINKMSSVFNTIMPYFIQNILKNYDQERIEKIFDNAHLFISEHPLINDPDISPDNLPRIINNFAALKTSWQVMSDFFFSDKPEEMKTEYQNCFNQNLIALMKENIDRINNYKPEVVFEQGFWDLVQNGTLSLRRVNRLGKLEVPSIDEMGKNVGYYTVDGQKVRIIIQLTNALREMRGRVENFAISEDALRAKLLKEGKIKTSKCGRFSLNDYKARGVEWIAEYPRSIFGLKEESDPVEEASEILAENFQF